MHVPRKSIAISYLAATTVIVTRALGMIGSGASETAWAFGIAGLFAVTSVVVTIATLRR
jgi:hypothetical protein